MFPRCRELLWYNSRCDRRLITASATTAYSRPSSAGRRRSRKCERRDRSPQVTPHCPGADPAARRSAASPSPARRAGQPAPAARLVRERDLRQMTSPGARQTLSGHSTSGSCAGADALALILRCRIVPFLDQGGAATRHRVRRSPRRALALGRPRPARPRRPSRSMPLMADDLSGTHALRGTQALLPGHDCSHCGRHVKAHFACHGGIGIRRSRPRLSLSCALTAIRKLGAGLSG